jgi:ADP-ribose pyrophosphatase
MLKNPYRTLNSRILWRSPWYALREDQIQLPDGSRGVYTVVERPGAVWIVPVLEDGRLVLIRNYRYTVDRWLWEVPAGGLEPGAPPEENARRELAEEIGGRAESLEQVFTMYTLPGISDEKGYVFLARGVRLGETHREPSEVMERHIFSTQQVMRMIRRGEIVDGPSVLALLICAPLLQHGQ